MPFTSKTCDLAVKIAATSICYYARITQSLKINQLYFLSFYIHVYVFIDFSAVENEYETPRRMPFPLGVKINEVVKSIITKTGCCDLHRCL